MLNVKNLSQNATGIVKLLETLEIWLLFKKEMGLSKKISCYIKIAKGQKLVAECHWNS